MARHKVEKCMERNAIKLGDTNDLVVDYARQRIEFLPTDCRSSFDLAHDILRENNRYGQRP